MLTMTRVAILGATGYTALEAIKILLRHPGVEITALTSRQAGRPPIASVHPSLCGRLDLCLEDLPPAEVARRAECVFSCLPHGASAAVVPELLSGGCKVVDFSADYRLNDPAVFAEWYGEAHRDPERLGQAVYGLPELFREQIIGTSLVANPGCYPTSAILALAPLLKAKVVAPDGIIVDSKSGVSGAGRTPKPTTLYGECNESVAAYSIGRHRHTPEIDQILTTVCGSKVEVIFTPHLVPMDRGILSVTYSRPVRPVAEADVLKVLREFYAHEPFVRVVDHLPATKDCSGTNYCHLTARVVRGRVLTVSCIDNLIKGAAGAAVQNFNLLYGYPETTAL
jgi:N-acetyl-gamma-glutamyl-phosphate reductase